MNTKDLEKIFSLFQTSNLSKLEWIKDDEKIILERSENSIPPIVNKDVEINLSDKKSTNKSIEITGNTENKDQTENLNYYYITAPLVGTFYKSSHPDSPPYVEVGDKIKEGDTLCIIEAMKLMNEIDSEINGIVEEILIDNGSPVEFGTKLYAVKTEL